MGKIIGIDLGTTNSVVAVMEGKEPKEPSSSTRKGRGSRRRSSPSTTRARSSSGQIAAKRQAVTNPTNTVYSAKRFMGRRLRRGDRGGEARVPYKVIKGKNNDVMKLRGDPRQADGAARRSAPRSLQKLKQAAEDYLGEKVSEAVITWCRRTSTTPSARRRRTRAASPASTSSVHRQRADRGRARLRPRQGSRKRSSRFTTSAAAPSTSSILEVGDNVVQVISTNGDTHLGGDDVDHLVMDWPHRRVQEGHRHRRLGRQDGRPAPQGRGRAGEDRALERDGDDDQPAVPHRRRDAGRSTSRSSSTRAKLEQMIRPLVDRLLEPLKKALADAQEDAAADQRGRPRRRLRRAFRSSTRRSRSSSGRSRTRA